MDRQTASNSVEQSWTQFMRKESRGGEPRKRTWWPSRKDAPAPSNAKREPPSQEKAEQHIRSSATTR